MHTLKHAYNIEEVYTRTQRKRGTDERENTTFAQKINRPNSLKTVPSGVVNCRNLSFGGRASRDLRVSVPRKEYA